MSSSKSTGWRKAAYVVAGALFWVVALPLFVVALGFMGYTMVVILLDLYGAW